MREKDVFPMVIILAHVKFITANNIYFGVHVVTMHCSLETKPGPGMRLTSDMTANSAVCLLGIVELCLIRTGDSIQTAHSYKSTFTFPYLGMHTKLVYLVWYHWLLLEENCKTWHGYPSSWSLSGCSDSITLHPNLCS